MFARLKQKQEILEGTVKPLSFKMSIGKQVPRLTKAFVSSLFMLVILMHPQLISLAFP